MTTMTPIGPQLPIDLAPLLVARVRSLLAEVSLTRVPVRSFPSGPFRGPRCVVCHRAGKLGGHHGEDGEIEWIHSSCHRKLHRRGRQSARRTAC